MTACILSLGIRTCKIVSARAVDSWSVGLLVELFRNWSEQAHYSQSYLTETHHSSGLVLGMAGPGQAGEVGVEEVAVGDLVGRRDGVGKHVGLAVPVDVGTIGRR